MNLQGWRRIPAPKSIIYVGEYILMRWVIFFLTALPYEMATGLVRNFIRFGYGLAGKYRNITAENIRLANPPVVTSPDEANHLALRTFEYFGLSFVHMLYMDRFIHLKAKKHISFENPEVIDRALKEKRGVILISGHLGNWEIGINELAKKGFPINPVRDRSPLGDRESVTPTPTSPKDDPKETTSDKTSFTSNGVNLVAFQYVNPYLNNMMNQFRLRCGVKIIPTKGAIKHCEAALNRGEAVIMLVDQTGREDGVEAQFFGRTAPAMWGPANLHLKTGAPIIPYGTIFTTKTQSSQRIHYTIKVGNMIEFEASGNKDEDIKKLAQIYLTEIEKIIRQAPEQWIWFHRRWKKYK